MSPRITHTDRFPGRTIEFENVQSSEVVGTGVAAQLEALSHLEHKDRFMMSARRMTNPLKSSSDITVTAERRYRVLFGRGDNPETNYYINSQDALSAESTPAIFRCNPYKTAENAGITRFTGNTDHSRAEIRNSRFT